MKQVFKRKLNAFVIIFVAALFIVPAVCAALLLYIREQTENILYLIIPTVLGLFLLYYGITEYFRTITFTDKEMTLAFRVTTKSKDFKKKKITVKFEDIRHVQQINLNSNGLLTRDTFIYYFYLNDGSEFRTYFYPFGKRSEKEIINILSEKTDFGKTE